MIGYIHMWKNNKKYHYHNMKIKQFWVQGISPPENNKEFELWQNELADSLQKINNLLQ